MDAACAGSFVGGSIQIKQSAAADISGVDIDSDLLFDDNTRSLNAAGNIIGGNLQAFQNTGGVSIFNNRVGGNLQCKENVPPPTGKIISSRAPWRTSAQISAGTICHSCSSC